MDEMKAISESDNEVIADLRRIVGIKKTAEIVKQCGGAFLYTNLRSFYRQDWQIEFCQHRKPNAVRLSPDKFG